MTEDASPEQGKTGGFGKGVFWSFVFQVGTQVLGGGSAFVMAYLVGPFDFGLVSMAAVLITVMYLFLEAGLVTAIIQRKDLEPLHLNSVFWLNTVVGIVLVASAWALSGWWAAVNRTPELANVIVILAFTLPLQGCSVVQMAIAQRERDFKALAQRSNIATFVGAVVGISWALYAPSYVPILAQRLITAGLGSALLWRIVPWRPALAFSWPHARELLAFSSGVLLSRLGIRFARSSDALLLGFFFGPETVGVYRLAKRAVGIVYNLTTRPLWLVAMPLFAERQSRPDLIRETLLAAVKYGTMATIPAMMALAAVAPSMGAVLSPEWRAAAMPLAILAGVSSVQSMTAFTDPMLFAVGKSMIRAAMVGVLAVCNPIAYTTAAVLLESAPMSTQLIGIALAELAVYILVFTPVNLLIAQWVAGRLLGDFVTSALPPTLAGVAAGAAGFATVTAAQALGLPAIVVTGVGSVVGGAVGLGVLWWIEPEASRIGRVLWDKVRRRARPAAKPVSR